MRFGLLWSRLRPQKSLPSPALLRAKTTIDHRVSTPENLTRKKRPVWGGALRPLQQNDPSAAFNGPKMLGHAKSCRAHRFFCFRDVNKENMQMHRAPPVHSLKNQGVLWVNKSHIISLFGDLARTWRGRTLEHRRSPSWFRY